MPGKRKMGARHRLHLSLLVDDSVSNRLDLFSGESHGRTLHWYEGCLSLKHYQYVVQPLTIRFAEVLHPALASIDPRLLRGDRRRLHCTQTLIVH